MRFTVPAFVRRSDQRDVHTMTSGQCNILFSSRNVYAERFCQLNLRVNTLSVVWACLNRLANQKTAKYGFPENRERLPVSSFLRSDLFNLLTSFNYGHF